MATTPISAILLQFARRSAVNGRLDVNRPTVVRVVVTVPYAHAADDVPEADEETG